MTFGKMVVDWEDRVDLDKLKKDRVEKANNAMKKHGIGTAVIYDWDMKRYVSSYWCHPYSKHHPTHFHLLIRDAGFPYVSVGPIDPTNNPVYGSMKCSWLKDRLVGDDILSEPRVLTMEADTVMVPRWKKTVQQIKMLMKKHGVADMPLSIDYAGTHLVQALQDAGVKVVDGNVWAHEARLIKTDEEIELLRMSATCNEAGYSELAKVLRAGMTENQAMGVFIKAVHDAGGEYEEGWVTGSGIRHAPRQFNWADRTIRPGELFSIECCHVNFLGYKNCYDRAFLVGAPKPNLLQKEMYDFCVERQKAVMNAIRPGITTHDLLKARGDIPRDFKNVDYINKMRNELGTLSEDIEKTGKLLTGWANHFGGMGMGHSDGPRIDFSATPVTLERNMVIAHGFTRWVTGYQGVGLENTYRVTNTGCELLTVYPWEELPIVGYP